MCWMPLIPYFYLTTVSFVFYKLWFNEWQQVFFFNTIVYGGFTILGLVTLLRHWKKKPIKSG
jgi:hypothetical protein